jgi:hypothetical protein
MDVPETGQGWSKKKILGVAALSVVGVLVAVSWAWDATHHDDHGAHGAPLTSAEIAYELGGMGFEDQYGSILTIRGAKCSPGKDGHGTEPAAHFRCDLKFEYESDTVVVHVLPREFLFKSNLR